MLRSPFLRMGIGGRKLDWLTEGIEIVLGQVLNLAGYEDPLLNSSFAAMGRDISDLDGDFATLEGESQPEQLESFIDAYEAEQRTPPAPLFSMTPIEFFMSAYEPYQQLDLAALGQDLRQLVADSEANIDFVLSVFDALGSWDRDAVAYYFVEPLSESELITLAVSENGQKLLARLRDEMTGGAQWPAETAEILRIVNVLAAATQPLDISSVAFLEPPKPPPLPEPKVSPVPRRMEFR